MIDAKIRRQAGSSLSRRPSIFFLDRRQTSRAMPRFDYTLPFRVSTNPNRHDGWRSVSLARERVERSALNRRSQRRSGWNVDVDGPGAEGRVGERRNATVRGNADSWVSPDESGAGVVATRRPSFDLCAVGSEKEPRAKVSAASRSPPVRAGSATRLHDLRLPPAAPATFEVMKVRSYPGRAVLEDPELLLDPDATRGRAMELLYEASWRECGVNWAGNGGGKITARQPDDESCKRPYADVVVSQLEATPREEDARSRGSSSTGTTDSECPEINQPPPSNAQGGFLIPRPRLIVPVHTYARRRRTGAPQPIKRRQMREGTCPSRIWRPASLFCARSSSGYTNFFTSARDSRASYDRRIVRTLRFPIERNLSNVLRSIFLQDFGIFYGYFDNYNSIAVCKLAEMFSNRGFVTRLKILIRGFLNFSTAEDVGVPIFLLRQISKGY